MDAESPQRKTPSPRACTEVISLQKNKTRNREALERGLLCRRPVKELVNQGILLNPSICNALKVKELQRAKTADILKRKIERRPDKQVLINRRILKTNETGASPFIQERCNTLTKNQLCESLNIKLERRPGSLELVEKGVLQVDPGVATLIRGGSIPYPRVSSTSPTLLFTVPEGESIIDSNPPPPPPPPPDVEFKTPSPALRPSASKSRTPSRSLKDETIISRYGSLVFHNYCPSSAASSNSPSLRVNGSTSATTCSTAERLPKHRAREVQQAELLHLEDAAQVHRRLGQEICQLKGQPPHKIAQSTQINPLFQPVVIAQHSQPPPTHHCFVVSGSAHSLQTTMPPPPSPPVLTPPISQKVSSQIFSNHVFEDGRNTLVTLNNGHSPAKIASLSAQIPQQHKVLTLLPATSPLTAVQPVGSAEPTQKVASLAEIESVWLDLRRLQHDITEEASKVGLNIYSSDGFPGAFTVATAGEVEPNHPTYQRLNRLVRDHANLCSLARLLISDRLEFLDEMDPSLPPPGEPPKAPEESLGGGDGALGNGDVPMDIQKKPVGSELERSLLQSYLCRLGGNYYRGTARNRRGRQMPPLSPTCVSSSSGGQSTAGIGATSAQSQAFWRNSTILPAHSSNVFCQQQTCQSAAQKLNGSLVEFSPAAQAWMDQFCSPTELQAAPFSAASTAPTTVPTATVVTTPVLHTTSSMPANLHLVDAPSAVLLSPAMPAPLPLPSHAVATTVGGNGGMGILYPSPVGCSSGSSGPGLTAGDSSCSVSVSSNGQLLQRTENNLMTMEFSPADLNGLSSSPREGNHDLSDVQDFLSSFPFDEHCEELMAFSSASPVVSSVVSATSIDSRPPPGPHFFVPLDADKVWSQGLMDIS